MQHKVRRQTSPHLKDEIRIYYQREESLMRGRQGESPGPVLTSSRYHVSQYI
jgi:hypothetical protein